MRAVMTFYRFVRLTRLTELAEALERAAATRALTGTILLADEGINATLSGERQALTAFHDELLTLPPFADLPARFSGANPETAVFHRLKVRVRREIVRFGQPDTDPAARTGDHVDAAQWNALLDDPDVLVLDTRNRYEIAVGSFPGAMDPGTRSFRELPGFVRERLDPARHPRVAMFCTGGIRCEKASSWLLGQGFRSVCQLDGGILRYLETVAPEQNRWQGECFVFDQRVSVNAVLQEGALQQCFACRRPLSAAALASPHYHPGVSCPHCAHEHDDRRRERFRERRRQVALAARRGERHLGSAPQRPDSQ